MASGLALRDAILSFEQHKPLRAALFLSFTFDGRWFHDSILPDLCERPIETLLVVRDGNAITSELPSLRATRANAGRSRLFHPKLVLLVSDERARAIISSSNLTRGGYERQREMGRVFDLMPGETEERSFFASLLQYLEEGVVTELAGNSLQSLHEIVAALRDLVGAAKAGRGTHLLLHNYQRALWDQILDALPHRHVRRVAVVSPFYEPDRDHPEDPQSDPADDSAFVRLLGDLKLDEAAEPPVTVYFRHVRGKTELPLNKAKQLTKQIAFHAQREIENRLHGKLLLFEGARAGKHEPFLVAVYGSPNFTSAALHRVVPAGNAELAVLTRLPVVKNGFAECLRALGLDSAFAPVDLKLLEPRDGLVPPLTIEAQGGLDVICNVENATLTCVLATPLKAGERLRVLADRDGASFVVGEATADGTSRLVVDARALFAAGDGVTLTTANVRFELLNTAGEVVHTGQAPINVESPIEFCELTRVGPLFMTLDEQIARAGVGAPPTYREQQQLLEQRRIGVSGGRAPSVLAHHADLDRFYRNVHQGLRGVKQRRMASKSVYALRRALNELFLWCGESVRDDARVPSLECRLFLVDRVLQTLEAVTDGVNDAFADTLPAVVEELKARERLRLTAAWLTEVTDPALRTYVADSRARVTRISKSLSLGAV